MIWTLPIRTLTMFVPMSANRARSQRNVGRQVSISGRFPTIGHGLGPGGGGKIFLWFFSSIIVLRIFIRKDKRGKDECGESSRRGVGWSDQVRHNTASAYPHIIVWVDKYCETCFVGPSTWIEGERGWRALPYKSASIKFLYFIVIRWIINI